MWGWPQPTRIITIRRVVRVSASHEVTGTNPGFVNSGSVIITLRLVRRSSPRACIRYATINGVLTNFNAPVNDLDYITRGNPPTIGAYETTYGNSSIAYSGFDYSTTGKARTMTDGAADYGWVQTTWSGGTIVSPGLTYSSLPVLGLALSNGANIASDRTINPSNMPAGYTVVGTDGVTRLGAAGTTVWVSCILEPTSATSGTCALYLDGIGTGGTEKLAIGAIGSTLTSWGVGNDPEGHFAYATGSASPTTGVPAFPRGRGHIHDGGKHGQPSGGVRRSARRRPRRPTRH